MAVRNIKEMIVYRKAYEQAMAVFELSKRFPPEERYALTTQLRRSSRSVCMNLREAWAKRRYPAHFVSKLTDCDGENQETETSLDFAQDCGYISDQEYAERIQTNQEIGKMLGAMIGNPIKFVLGSKGGDASSLPPASGPLPPEE
jgi:four helix bundle protein